MTTNDDESGIVPTKCPPGYAIGYYPGSTFGDDHNIAEHFFQQIKFFIEFNEVSQAFGEELAKPKRKEAPFGKHRRWGKR